MYIINSKFSITANTFTIKHRNSVLNRPSGLGLRNIMRWSNVRMQNRMHYYFISGSSWQVSPIGRPIREIYYVANTFVFACVYSLRKPLPEESLDVYQHRRAWSVTS